MERTKYFLSRRHDIWAARSAISRNIKIFIILVLVASGLIYFAFFSPFSTNQCVKFIGSFALFLIGTVILILLIQTPYFISVHLESGQSLVGEPEPVTRSGSQVSPQVDVAKTTPPLIRAVGEKITATSIEPGRWHITLNFTVFNDSTSPLLVYDMHARVYCRWYELIPDISLTIRARREVSLSQDNTITHEGKVFEIGPSENESFALSLEISRNDGDTPTDDWTMTVFSIFVDIHESNDTLCYPVNCVFCFMFIPAEQSADKKNRIEVFHINEGNIVGYWERFYRDPGWRRIMKVIDASLAKHIGSIRRHV